MPNLYTETGKDTVKGLSKEAEDEFNTAQQVFGLGGPGAGRHTVKIDPAELGRMYGIFDAAKKKVASEEAFYKDSTVEQLCSERARLMASIEGGEASMGRMAFLKAQFALAKIRGELDYRAVRTTTYCMP